MTPTTGFRRSSQKAALPLAGWDIAVQLDEDLRLGNNLIECLEYVDGTRLFVLIDVNVPGTAGSALAARLRGVVCSMGILNPDPVLLLDAIFHEISDQPELIPAVGVLLADVCPGQAEVRLIVRNHPGALLIRRGEASTDGRGASADHMSKSSEVRPQPDATMTRTIVTESVVTDTTSGGSAAHTTLYLHPREAVLLVSRFACDVGDSVAIREARHAELAQKAQEAVDKGSSTAIDGILNMGSLVRESAGADWPNRLLSMVWIRRVSIAG